MFFRFLESSSTLFYLLSLLKISSSDIRDVQDKIDFDKNFVRNKSPTKKFILKKPFFKTRKNYDINKQKEIELNTLDRTGALRKKTSFEKIPSTLMGECSESAIEQMESASKLYDEVCNTDSIQNQATFAKRVIPNPPPIDAIVEVAQVHVNTAPHM